MTLISNIYQVRVGFYFDNVSKKGKGTEIVCLHKIQFNAKFCKITNEGRSTY